MLAPLIGLLQGDTDTDAFLLAFVRDLNRLLQTHRESGSPDWKVVQDDVAALRASNDETVRELLGDERFAAYGKHRPTVGPAPSRSLKTP